MCCCVQVLVPTCEFVQKLTAARLAADVADVPTLIIARTDALGAYLLTSDVDERDKPFCTGKFNQGRCYTTPSLTSKQHRQSITIVSDKTKGV